MFIFVAIGVSLAALGVSIAHVIVERRRHDPKRVSAMVISEIARLSRDLATTRLPGSRTQDPGSDRS